jgi:hypothetical protein
MSSLWKIAAHWKGAPILIIKTAPSPRPKPGRTEQKGGGKMEVEVEGGNARTVQNLTSPTMAILGLKRLLSTQLILDSPTMTTAFVQGVETLFFGLHFVRSAEFPFAVLTFYV